MAEPPDAFGHSTTQLVRVTADRAYAFLMDGKSLGRWSFGCWDTEPVGDGVWTGLSQIDGGRGYFRADGDPARMIIDWHLGPAPDRLTPRIMARVVPGPRMGLTEGECLISLVAWKNAAMAPERWQQLVSMHEAEIRLIKNLLERDAGMDALPLRAA